MKRLLSSFCVVVSLLLVTSSTFQHTQAFANYNQQEVIKIAEEQHTQKEIQKQIECLADNIYHESRGESYDGKLAVAFVTINRTKDDNFPDNICAVVKQKNKNTCQFSWYCEKNKKEHSRKSYLTKLNDEVYNDVKRMAEFVFYNYNSIKDPTRGALYYHANYVQPNWKKMKKTAKIGRHIFYTVLT